MSFEQKVVLITDGSSGLGATTAKLFARERAIVVIVGADEVKLHEVAKCLVNLDAETLVIVADVTNDDESDAIIKTTIDKFSKLDVLVINTKVSREAGFLEDDFLETYEKVMGNMRSIVRITYFAVPHLIKTKGNIINVSNISGTSNRRPLNIACKASKAAMNDFTKNVALELAPYGVRVNTISPSPDSTDMFDVLKENSKKTAAQRNLSEPNEVADMILYIASHNGKGITGSNFWRKLRISDNKTNF